MDGRIVKINWKNTILNVKELFEKVEKDKVNGLLEDFYLDGDRQEIVLVLKNPEDWNVDEINIPTIDEPTHLYVDDTLMIEIL